MKNLHRICTGNQLSSDVGKDGLSGFGIKIETIFTALKILFLAMEVRVQFPSLALENQCVMKVLAASREAVFLFRYNILKAENLCVGGSTKPHTTKKSSDL